MKIVSHCSVLLLSRCLHVHAVIHKYTDQCLVHIHVQCIHAVPVLLLFTVDKILSEL